MNRIFRISVGAAPRALLLASLFACLLFTGNPARAQTAVSLRGTIVDPSGAAVPNATVHLIDSVNNSDHTVAGDARGNFTFQDIFPGTYHLVVDAPGFEKYEQDDVRIQANATATVAVQLRIVQVQQSLTVTGQSSGQCLSPQARILPGVGPGLRVIRRGPSGNYYVLTAPGTSVAIYSPSGKKVGQIPATPSPDSSIAYGSDLQLDATGKVYVADRAANAIKIYDAKGVLLKKVRVPSPISVEPLADGEIAVSSLLSSHLVDVYDVARGEMYRSFGDVAGPVTPECDPVTLRCTVPLNSGSVQDAAHLKDQQPPMNRAWFYGDSGGNVYVNLVDAATPTIRKYDSYGYIAYESPFTSAQLAADNGAGGAQSIAVVKPAGKSGGSEYGTDGSIGGGSPITGGGGLHGGAIGATNIMGYGIELAQHAKIIPTKLAIDALGVDSTDQEVWAAISGNLVHFDKDGNLEGTYCLSPANQASIKPSTIVVEPRRILLGIDPFGILQYARPDKPTPTVTDPTAAQ